MTVSILSPFRYAEDPRPSIFMAAGWGRGGSTGKTMNAIQSATVARKTRETGRSPGSISGLSKRGDVHIEESNHTRRRKG